MVSITQKSRQLRAAACGLTRLSVALLTLEECIMTTEYSQDNQHPKGWGKGGGVA